jgi:hypothetical protein
VVLRSLDAYRTRATIAVSIVSFFASLLLAVLVWLQHVRTVRPGNVILAFLSLNVLFDLAIVRTLWLVPVSRAIPIVYTTAFAFKASLLVAESVEKKRATLLPSYQHYGPEALAGFFNRAAFGWVNPLLLRGSREILTLRDLLSLDRKLHSEGIQANVTDHWQRHRQSTSRNALLWTLVGCFKWTLLAGLVPRACLVALTVVQPFLIETAINLSAAPSTPVNKNHGYAMVGAYALVYTGIAVRQPLSCPCPSPRFPLLIPARSPPASLATNPTGWSSRSVVDWSPPSTARPYCSRPAPPALPPPSR